MIVGMQAVWVVFFSFFVFVLGQRPAEAQDIPYANYLVGERALGLGGAFVGLAEDASATFHNPAGLSLVSGSEVSTSFWVAGWQHRRLESGWSTTEGRSDFSDSKLTFPPLVFTAVTRVGSADESGEPRHALGAAILKPLRQTYRYAAVTNGADNDLAALDVVHEDDARWYGLSYALRLPYRLSIGLSAFAALRSLSHEEVEMHGRDGVIAPTPENQALSRHSLFTADLRDLLWRFGVTWQPGTCWRIGLMVQLPSISLGGSASSRQLTLNVEPDGQMAVDNIVHDELRAWRRIPWEVRAGVTHFWGNRALVTADVAFHGSSGSAQDPVRLVRDDTVPRPRLLPMESFLTSSMRIAVGGEYVFRERFPFRGGVMLYTSGRSRIPATSDKPTDSDMTTFGLSLSAGLLVGDGHEVSLGGSVIHSSGIGTALDQTGAGMATYSATGTSETTLLIFISGAIGGAKVLVEKGEEWLEEEQRKRASRGRGD